MANAEAKTKRVGEAGHWGKDVRSDAHVWIEPRERGGIDIVIESRVKSYYGDAIRSQTESLMEALGVAHAQVLIHDEGALPFAIAARIEAAVRRAGLAEGKRALPDSHPYPEPSARDRMRRSRLYLPGSEPKYFVNAMLHRPDAIILLFIGVWDLRQFQEGILNVGPIADTEEHAPEPGQADVLVLGEIDADRRLIRLAGPARTYRWSW